MIGITFCVIAKKTYYEVIFLTCMGFVVSLTLVVLKILYKRTQAMFLSFVC